MPGESRTQNKTSDFVVAALESQGEANTISIQGNNEIGIITRARARQMGNIKSKKSSVPNIEEELQCPVCLEPPRLKQIFNCKFGHPICEECHFKVANCPICRDDGPRHRNTFAEKAMKAFLSGKTILCKYTKEGCQTKGKLEAVLLHEDMCSYRTVSCPARHRSACGWTGHIRNLLLHLTAKECVQIVNVDEHTLTHSSVIGDFIDRHQTVFHRNRGVTHWKPALLMSSSLEHLMMYVVILRTKRGEWSISVRSFASSRVRESVAVRITAKVPRQPEPEDGTTLRRTFSPEFQCVTNLVPFDITEEEVAGSGNFLHLFDSQVQQLTIHGITLLEYSIEILPRARVLQ